MCSPKVSAMRFSLWPVYYKNKELRFSAADGEWRVAFAFDPMRKADKRFDAHLTRIGRGT
jgi:hypothetical protein